MKYMTVKLADAISAEEIQQAIADITARDAAVAESEAAAEETAEADTPVPAESAEKSEAKTEETPTVSE